MQLKKSCPPTNSRADKVAVLANLSGQVGATGSTFLFLFSILRQQVVDVVL